MHAHLETALREPGAQIRRHNVGTLGDEVEGGAEPQLHLELRELAALLQSLGSLDIVGQHEGELLALRPAGPTLGRTGGRFVDRPDVSAGLLLPTAKEPADGHAHAPRDKRLELIVDTLA